MQSRKALLKTGKKYALRTDGVNDYARTDDSSYLGTPTALTVCGFVTKRGEGHTYEVSIHRSTNTAIGQSDFFLGFETSNDRLLCSIGAKNTHWNNGRTATLAVLGTEYHIAAVWDGSTVRRFVNGVFDGSYALTSLSLYSSVPTRLGSSSNGGNYEYNGDQRDTRIYNRALSDDEIGLLAKEMPVSKAGLIAHWDCNQPSGSIVKDLAGNGADMTLYNGAAFVER